MRRPLLALSLLLLPVALLAAPPQDAPKPKPKPKPKRKPKPKPKKVPVEVERLKKTVEYLAGLKPARSYAHRKSLNKAATYIQKALQKAGYEVDSQTYEVAGEVYRNLICFAGPAAAPRVVVGAHYDVAGDKPGADDNASGIAGLLELARLIAQRKPQLKNRLELVAYTLEEPPYFRTDKMGSYVHAKSLADAKVTVKAMICLEMIGYFDATEGSQRYPLPQMKQLYPTAGNYIAVVGNPASRKLVALVEKRMKAAITLDVQTLVAPARLRGIDFSDHLNYWAYGYPAVMISDTSFYRNRNYHRKTDTPETLDYRSMAQVVEGVYAAVTQAY